MTRLTILHTNDIHGRIEGLARVATVVGRIRAESDHPVFYVDAGDVEETTTRISNITKGAAMHRLLSTAGCDVATAGNAGWLRYGPGVLAEHAAAARHPILLANLKPVPGVRDSVLLEDTGFVGVTASFAGFFGESLDMGVEALPEIEVVRELARSLRAQGAARVVVLSHLGFDVPEASIDDYRLTEALQDDIDLVIGAHSHTLLPQGERIGRVLVAQAGEYARHVGRVDIDGDRLEATVIPVSDDVPQHAALSTEVEQIEIEAEVLLAEPIGELAAPLDPQWVAEMLRTRMRADVGLAVANQVLSGTLPPGLVRRGEIWEVCGTSANPGVVTMTGAQLLHVIARGRELEDVAPRQLRGRRRGPLQVAGAADDIAPEREYRVAATDYELEPYGEMVERDWGLRPRYDFPTIVREAIEEHLAEQQTVTRSEARE